MRERAMFMFVQYQKQHQLELHGGHHAILTLYCTFTSAEMHNGCSFDAHSQTAHSQTSVEVLKGFFKIVMLSCMRLFFSSWLGVSLWNNCFNSYVGSGLKVWNVVVGQISAHTVLQYQVKLFDKDLFVYWHISSAHHWIAIKLALWFALLVLTADVAI